jgi:hypothetical protein
MKDAMSGCCPLPRSHGLPCEFTRSPFCNAEGRNWPRLCENSARYNSTRNFEACGPAQSEKTQKFILRSALRPNQISFSHSLGPRRNPRPTAPGGRLKYREDVVEGQENAPAAFPGLLQSENFGKVLVKGRMSQSKQSERSFDPPPGP